MHRSPELALAENRCTGGKPGARFTGVFPGIRSATNPVGTLPRSEVHRLSQPFRGGWTTCAGGAQRGCSSSMLERDIDPGIRWGRRHVLRSAIDRLDLLRVAVFRIASRAAVGAAPARPSQFETVRAENGSCSLPGRLSQCSGLANNCRGTPTARPISGRGLIPDGVKSRQLRSVRGSTSIFVGPEELTRRPTADRLERQSLERKTSSPCGSP